MVTPDFEDWLLKQEFRPDVTADEDVFIDYLKSELGIKGGSIDVARRVYRERYVTMADLGIYSTSRTIEIAGEKWEELRYVIKGRRGLYGRLNTYRIAAEIAEEQGMYETADFFRRMASYLEKYPERRIARWRAEEH